MSNSQSLTLLGALLASLALPQAAQAIDLGGGLNLGTSLSSGTSMGNFSSFKIEPSNPFPFGSTTPSVGGNSGLKIGSPPLSIRPPYSKEEKLANLRWERDLQRWWFYYEGIKLWFSLPSLAGAARPYPQPHLEWDRRSPQPRPTAEWRMLSLQERAEKLKSIDAQICALDPDSCRPPQPQPVRNYWGPNDWPDSTLSRGGGGGRNCEYSHIFGGDGCRIRD